jgi:hypothetical protein
VQVETSSARGESASFQLFEPITTRRLLTKFAVNCNLHSPVSGLKGSRHALAARGALGQGGAAAECGSADS